MYPGAVIRLPLHLAERSDWLKLFDPRGGALFVPTAAPPEPGTEVRVDLTITDGGPRVILKGSVVWKRSADGRDPAGCNVGLSPEDREKINFINGFVRGGLINRRERRRLPLRLPVTFGGLDGPQRSHTRDLNEEGVFIVFDHPLPEDTTIHFVMGVPGRAEPLQLKGVVTHTVIPEDEDVPGMGVRFELDERGQAEIKAVVDQLEAALYRGTLPEDVLT